MITTLFLAALQQTPAAQKPLMERLQFEAEGRMRGEATFDNIDAATGNEVDDRYRGRFRFRAGAKYTMTDDVLIGARISTASDGNDANNPHWDFGDGDGFNGSQMVLDRFYIDWKGSEELHVVFGKQPNAFAMPPIYGDFVWDSDISPSGISAAWKPAQKEGEIAFDARAAAYVATEVAADEDPKMWGVQANLYAPLEKGKVQLSSAIQDWRDNDDTAVAGNQGNSATTEDFMVWDTFVAGTLPGGPLDEMTAYVQFINNLDESEQGWVVGGQLGATQWKTGNVNAFALLYDLDGDALFSPTAQDDTPVAGTGLNDGDGDGQNGVVFGGTYWWRDNAAFKLWVLTSNAAGADDDPVRLRFDFDFKVK